MADNKKLTKQDLTGSNKTSRRKWLLTALAAAAIAAGGAWYGGVFAPDAAPAYRTADITRGNLMVTVTANGTVNPVRTVSIGSELSGIVRNVLVDVNSVVKKGDVVTLATEAVGQGRVYVAGTVFLSNFEISDSSSVDYGDASYANKVIAQNIVSSILEEREISTIAEAREGEVGDIFTVEGVVTAGNVEPNAFFDTIYIQDETGGIDLYPVSSADGTFLVGQTVRVTGSWDQYQGDVELRVIDIELVDSTIQPVEPKELTLEQANDYDTYGGWLAKVRGTVTSVELVSEQVSEVMLSDGTHEFRLLFNNYIGYSQDGSTPLETFAKVGADISAVGVVYYDPDGACLRIRDRSEVELVDDQQPEEDDTTQPGDDAGKPGQSTDDSGNNAGNTTKPDGDKNPQTGDTHQMMPYVAVLVVAMGALCGLVTLHKRVRR